MGNKKISLSGEEKELEEIMSWYQDQKTALLDFKDKIINIPLYSAGTYYSKFSDFSIEEINSYFDQSIEELTHLVCFSLISATEAKLRIDYNIKATEKHKTDIAIAFREIYRMKHSGASLKGDIIECWKRIFYEKKRIFESFNMLLSYRHWLAHGRYWTRKFGTGYNVEDTYDITESVYNIIASH